ncbi:hypothetical protein M0654_19870 [Rhizobium sp. NTR19]|uniref:Uncharacterized protein n=1 Tax=Neorhizobium turbinariae TaxID=2937795 RepID=A0ABT0IWI3_9HYPH|nr:hypothetical protein [Neorhizobium turbinariae]MCK8782241.1 hypothetical protein [Neorhizobium turbinariae]
MKNLVISILALAASALLPVTTLAEEGEYYEGISPHDDPGEEGSTDMLRTGSTTRYGLPSPPFYRQSASEPAQTPIDQGDYYEGAVRPN